LTSRKINVSGQSGTYTDRKSGSFEEFEGKEHVVPHVRDPGILLRHDQAAVDRNLVAHAHPPIDLDQVHPGQGLLDLADLLGGLTVSIDCCITPTGTSATT
jgi:hypothetical protein